MVERVVLTDKLVQALVPSDKRYDVIDVVDRGLLASVNPGGTVTLMLRTRIGARSPIRRAIGQHGRGIGQVTVEQARRVAREWLELLKQGGDPREAQRRAREDQRRAREAADVQAANTFALVFDKFCARKLQHQRRGAAVARTIRRDLLPAWRDRPLVEITHRDVREALERVVERGATAYAHNVLDAARALFAFALERDLIEHNPCDRLRRQHIIGNKRHRERTLSDDELRALWRATRRLGYPFGPLYQMLMLTGARRNEVAGMRWSEVDWERKVWTVPAERFKTAQQHSLPLTPDAVAVLTALPRFRRGDCVFSTSYGERPVRGFSKAKQRADRYLRRTLRALARLRGDDLPAQVKPWQIHDIRRTLRSRLSALRIQDHVAELVIGHQRRGIAAVYDRHEYEDEKREALTKWEALLRSIVSPPRTDGKVVALRGKGKK